MTTVPDLAMLAAVTKPHTLTQHSAERRIATLLLVAVIEVAVGCAAALLAILGSLGLALVGPHTHTNLGGVVLVVFACGVVPVAGVTAALLLLVRWARTGRLELVFLQVTVLTLAIGPVLHFVGRLASRWHYL
ncbi:hypothetical protein ACH47Z_35990 [Streptomyces sp. NPDC020192]|uniref:hypothetical protein n=1 Tax=Streptomyces sp. NPDC020192 TaxID=3365066 RepID=UPI00379C0644